MTTPKKTSLEKAPSAEVRPSWLPSRRYWLRDGTHRQRRHLTTTTNGGAVSAMTRWTPSTRSISKASKRR